jgi:protocatechuate 3,4-dioxygenase beta subunit
MNSSIFSSLVLTFFLYFQATSTPNKNEHIPLALIDTCDNPDASIGCCFINVPPSLTSVMRIANEEEKGEKLIISGTIFKADGKTPCPNVTLYAYHTDSKGYYSKSGTETGAQKWHGRLHGWCRTDQDGRYEIRTIRPARYPDNSIPAHIHAAIKTSTGQMQWISDFVFKDDDLVNEKYRSTYGGSGVVDIKKTHKDIWAGKRDIVLQ